MPYLTTTICSNPEALKLIGQLIEQGGAIGALVLVCVLLFLLIKLLSLLIKLMKMAKGD